MYQIRPVADGDFAAWRQLFSEYCAFYGFDCNDDKLTTVWQWLFDDQHVLKGLVADDGNGTVIGLLHFQTMPMSLFGADTGYLADLYVSPDHRRNGVARLLHEAFVATGKEKGWPFGAWLAQEGNSTARAMYDQSADLTDLRYYVQGFAD